jgi:hypothetical protein
VGNLLATDLLNDFALHADEGLPDSTQLFLLKLGKRLIYEHPTRYQAGARCDKPTSMLADVHVSRWSLPYSVGYIAKTLKIGKSTVVKHLGVARAFGYIESSAPHKGGCTVNRFVWISRARAMYKATRRLAILHVEARAGDWRGLENEGRVIGAAAAYPCDVWGHR